MKITEKGKLIISTKSTERKRKVLIVVCSVYLFIVGVVILFVPGAFEAETERLLGHGASRLPIIIFVILFLWELPVFNIINVFLSSRSYCDVYEYCISGVSRLSISNPMQNFEIKYDEILNVTESGKSIIIYIQYTKYEVSAFKNRIEAINEIRSRIPDRSEKV